MSSDSEIARGLAAEQLPDSGEARVRAQATAAARHVALQANRVTTGQAERGVRLTLSVAAAALGLLLVLAAATPQGRALAEDLAEIVGVGEQSTFDYSSLEGVPAEGDSLVVASGTLPGTDEPYEWVAYVSRTPGRPDREYGAKPQERATCLTLDLPFRSMATVDPGVGCVVGVSADPVRASQIGPTGLTGALGREYGFAVSGEIQPRVARVEVAYENPSGERVVAPVLQGVVEGEVAERLDAPYGWGRFIAFLPDGMAAADDSEPGANVPLYGPTLEIRAFNESGELIGTDLEFGRRLGALPTALDQERPLSRRPDIRRKPSE